MAKLKNVTWQAPVDTSTVELSEDGRTFRKRVLRPMVLHYKGRKINLSEDKLRSMVDAYGQKAYDTVPLLLDGPLDHGVQDITGALRDPERHRGEAVGMDYAEAGSPEAFDGPGVYTTIRTNSKKASKSIRQNPNLGVSARIVPDHEDADGRKFPFAIQHILATTVPRVTGLGSWHPISLSMDDDREVIDLTGVEIEEITVAKAKGTKETAPEDAFVDLSDEQLADLLDEIADLADETEPDEDDDDLEDDGDEPDETDEETPVAELSRKDRKAINLAQSAAASALAETAVLVAQLASERWDRERLELANDGVPEWALEEVGLELAVPEADETSLDLADDDDPLASSRKVIRGLLDGLRGTIDLAGPVGHAGAPKSGVDIEAAMRAWDNTTGPVR